MLKFLQILKKSLINNTLVIYIQSEKEGESEREREREEDVLIINFDGKVGWFSVL